MAVMMASGPEAKRPPHMVLGVLSGLVMRRAFLLGLAYLLYTGFGASANAGTVPPGLLTGDMAKLVLAEVPRAVPDAKLLDVQDAPHSLAEFKGKWLVVNFWATWCVPCRLEMPALDRLQRAMPELAVMTVATGPNPLPAIGRFLSEAGVTGVTVWRDPDQALAHQVGILGLPVTLIVNPEGAEVGRLIGGAAWDAPEAQAVLAALMAK